MKLVTDVICHTKNWACQCTCFLWCFLNLMHVLYRCAQKRNIIVVGLSIQTRWSLATSLSITLNLVKGYKILWIAFYELLFILSISLCIFYQTLHKLFFHPNPIKKIFLCQSCIISKLFMSESLNLIFIYFSFIWIMNIKLIHYSTNSYINWKDF